MINEAKYRSPKWLRKFMDFEVSTGDDIKGKKSKRSIRIDKENKEKKTASEKFKISEINSLTEKHFFKKNTYFTSSTIIFHNILCERQ